MAGPNQKRPHVAFARRSARRPDKIVADQKLLTHEGRSGLAVGRALRAELLMRKRQTLSEGAVIGARAVEHLPPCLDHRI